MEDDNLGHFSHKKVLTKRHMKFVVRKAIANIGGVKKEIAVVRVAGVKIRIPVKVSNKNQK